MKNLGRKVVLTFFVFSLVFELSGQNQLSNRQIQFINLNALNLIEQYQFSFNLKRARDYDDFTMLFENSDVLITNDIMPDNNLNDQVTIDQYLSLYDSYYSRPFNVEIEPYEVRPIHVLDNKTGLVSIYAKKIASGPTKKEVRYQDTFDLEISIKFNLANSSFKIASIKSLKEQGKYYNLVLDINNLRDINDSLIMQVGKDKGSLGTKKIVPTEKGQYLVRNIDQEKDTVIIICSANLSLIPKYKLTNKNFERLKPALNKDKNSKIITFRQPLFYSEIVFGLNPFNQSPVEFTGNSYESNLTNNMSYYVGLNFGFSILKKRQLFIKAGLHFKQLEYINNLSSFSYSKSTVDSEFYSYLRTNTVSDIHEKTDLDYLVVPLALEKFFNLDKTHNYFISVEVGAAMNFLLNSNYKSDAEALYSGYYEDLFQITIAQNGVYDFGEFDLSDSGELESEKMTYSIYSSVGIGKFISRRSSIRFNCTYLKGIDYIFKETNNELSNDSSYLNSLTSISNQYHLNELYLDLRLNFKF